MGAAKAGVSVIVFDEKNDKDAFHQALTDSGARGIVFSPTTPSDDSGATRQSILEDLMPELSSLYPGDALKASSYPHLKQIVQTDHANIRGVIKFKDALVYANPAISAYSIP